jgi:hypothetical protein
MPTTSSTPASLGTRLISGLIAGMLSGLFVIVLLCIVAAIYALLGPGLTNAALWQRVGYAAAGVLCTAIIVGLFKSLRPR